MPQIQPGPYDQLSDDELMRRCLELSDHPDDNAAQMAAIDALIQQRLFATYGAAEPGSSPRVRYAASDAGSGQPRAPEALQEVGQHPRLHQHHEQHAIHRT